MSNPGWFLYKLIVLPVLAVFTVYLMFVLFCAGMIAVFT